LPVSIRDPTWPASPSCGARGRSMGEHQAPPGHRAAPPPAPPRALRDGALGQPRVVLALALVTVLVLGFLVVRNVSSADGPTRIEEADAYLAAWAEGDLEAMAARVVEPPPTFAAMHQQMTAALGVREAVFEAGDAL